MIVIGDGSPRLISQKRCVCSTKQNRETTDVLGLCPGAAPACRCFHWPGATAQASIAGLELPRVRGLALRPWAGVVMRAYRLNPPSLWDNFYLEEKKGEGSLLRLLQLVAAASPSQGSAPSGRPTLQKPNGCCFAHT